MSRGFPVYFLRPDLILIIICGRTPPVDALSRRALTSNCPLNSITFCFIWCIGADITTCHRYAPGHSMGPLKTGFSPSRGRKNGRGGTIRSRFTGRDTASCTEEKPCDATIHDYQFTASGDIRNPDAPHTVLCHIDHRHTLPFRAAHRRNSRHPTRMDIYSRRVLSMPQ